MIKIVAYVSVLILFYTACSSSHPEKQLVNTNDTNKIDSIIKVDSVGVTNETCCNDSLNAIANIMAGIYDSTATIYPVLQSSYAFKIFSTNFSKRWLSYDSSRLAKLRTFKEKEISSVVQKQTTLFYPFSGPDILYAQIFFPEADNYVMIGLEPVGSFPEFNKVNKDSLQPYFSKINTSLNAILKFSFFRTISMSTDLKNTEVDGTLHLLLLFLKRNSNSLCSVKPITIDSLGNIQFLESFANLKKVKTATKGVEIKFSDKNNIPKTLYYYSLNAADVGLKSNKGFVSYLNNLGTVNTYLKGASYLMHKSYFSIIRNYILTQSRQIIQDDSGIALRYFTTSNSKWNYSFYGSYLKPIPLFAGFYQSDLDSLYKQQGSKAIGFGIGYNFKDKNSNFMIATKQN